MSKVLSKQNQKFNKILKTTLLQQIRVKNIIFILAITKSVFHCEEENLNKARTSYISKVIFPIRFNRLYKFFQTVNNCAPCSQLSF